MDNVKFSTMPKRWIRVSLRIHQISLNVAGDFPFFEKDAIWNLVFDAHAKKQKKKKKNSSWNFTWGKN
jgi:hypothetical protein